MSRATLTTAALTALGLAAPALAQSASNPSAAPSLGPLLMLFVLVLALIPLALWLLKRIQPSQVAATAAGLRVVAQLPLGPRERVVVLEAGERWLLLGVTGTSIQRIGTLPKSDDEADLPAQANAFAAILQRIKPQ